jgi:hypothetical protein
MLRKGGNTFGERMDEMKVEEGLTQGVELPEE